MTEISGPLPVVGQSSWGPMVTEFIYELILEHNLQDVLLNSGRLSQAQLDAAYGGASGGVWGSITGVLEDQTDLNDILENLVAVLDQKSTLLSPTFTGDPKAPTPATSDNSTSIATTAFVKAQGYLDSIPQATESVLGGGEVATAAEAQAMTADEKLLTPAKLAEAASSSNIANRLVRRDANGRFQAALPSASSDVTTKGYVDALTLREYTSTTALDAAQETAQGTLILSDFTALGITELNDSYDELHVETTLNWYDTSPFGQLTQEIRSNVQTGEELAVWRRYRTYTSDWSAWTSWVRITIPVADEGVAGIAERATNAQVQSMTNLENFVTPAGLASAATSGPNSDRLMRRDGSGRAQVEDPSAAKDIVNKQTLDAAVGSGGGLPFQIAHTPPIGDWFTSPFWTGASHSTNTAARTGYFRMPFIVETEITIDALRFNLGTADASNTTTFQLQDADKVTIGADLATSAVLSATGVIELVFGSARVLTPGLYYINQTVSSGSITPRFYASKVNGPGTGGESATADPAVSDFSSVPFITNVNLGIQFTSPIIYLRRSA